MSTPPSPRPIRARPRSVYRRRPMTPGSWTSTPPTCGTLAKRGIDERVRFDRIPARRAELARDVHAAVSKTDPGASAIGLPAPPYDAWIMDLYPPHLRDFS